MSCVGGGKDEEGGQGVGWVLQLYLFCGLFEIWLYPLDLACGTGECVVEYSETFEAPNQTFKFAQSFGRLANMKAIE